MIWNSGLCAEVGSCAMDNKSFAEWLQNSKKRMRTKTQHHSYQPGDSEQFIYSRQRQSWFRLSMRLFHSFGFCSAEICIAFTNTKNGVTERCSNTFCFYTSLEWCGSWLAAAKYSRSHITADTFSYHLRTSSTHEMVEGISWNCVSREVIKPSLSGYKFAIES